MTKATFKKQYNQVIDLIEDDEFLKAVYEVLKIKSKESESLMTPKQKKEILKDLDDHKKGKLKYYTTEEIKKKAYANLKK